MEKKTNKTCAVGWRTAGEEGEMQYVGPTYFVTTPADSTPEEMEDTLDVLMALPQEVVGSAVVFREGFCITKIDDGPRLPVDQTVTLDD